MVSSVLFEVLKCLLCIFGIALLFAITAFLFRLGYEFIKQAITERNAIRETIEEAKNKSMIEQNDNK